LYLSTQTRLHGTRIVSISAALSPQESEIARLGRRPRVGVGDVCRRFALGNESWRAAEGTQVDGAGVPLLGLLVV